MCVCVCFACFFFLGAPFLGGFRDPTNDLALKAGDKTVQKR